MATLVLAVGAFRVAQGLAEQASDRKISAVIPVSFTGLDRALSGSLDDLACQADDKTTHGEEITYMIWDCEARHGKQVDSLLIYHRQDNPEAVDWVTAIIERRRPGCKACLLSESRHAGPARS